MGKRARLRSTRLYKLDKHGEQARDVNTARVSPPTQQMSPIEVDRLQTVARDLDLAAAPYPVFVIGNDGLIADANRNAEALVGYLRCELVGKPVELVISRFSSGARDGIRDVSTAYSGVCCAHHREGRELPVDVLSYPRDNDVVAIVRPLLARDQASVAGARSMRDENVAQIVHDLRGPLWAIALELELIGNGLAEPMSAGATRAFRRIGESVAFLDRLALEIIDSAAIDAAQFALRRMPIELRTLTNAVVDRVASTRDRERISMIAPEPVTLAIDEVRIERVIANLLNNALKHAPESPITARIDVSADHACVSITDRGPGIAAEALPHVFEKYRRAQPSRSPDGHGLGLYICKRIVELHGGIVGVRSARGDGLTFYFKLPRTT